MSVSPDVENYILGAGAVFFDRWDADGNATGEMDLGNAPAFIITPTVETLDHFESRTSERGRDASVNTSSGFVAKFTLEEYSMDNLALAFIGDDPENTIQGSGSVADEDITARENKWVKLDYRNVSDIVVKNDTDTITYGADDYNVDADTGRIKVLSTGSITDEQALHISYDYASLTLPTISALTRTPVEGFIRFIGDPMHGPSLEAEIWKCSLKPTSDVAFIGTDWGAIDFEVEILKDAANHPDDPYFKIYERADGFEEETS